MTILRTLLGLLLACWLALAGAQDFAPVPPLTGARDRQVGMLDAGAARDAGKCADRI